MCNLLAFNCHYITILFLQLQDCWSPQCTRTPQQFHLRLQPPQGRWMQLVCGIGDYYSLMRQIGAGLDRLMPIQDEKVCVCVCVCVCLCVCVCVCVCVCMCVCAPREVVAGVLRCVSLCCVYVGGRWARVCSHPAELRVSRMNVCDTRMR